MSYTKSSKESESEESEQRAEMPALTPPPAVEAEPSAAPADKLIEKVEKPPEKLATLSLRGKNNKGGPYNATNYAQIDYIMANDKWKNSITNVEADEASPIPTDHAPLLAKLKVKFRIRETKGDQKFRSKINRNDEDLMEEYNDKLRTIKQEWQNITIETRKIISENKNRNNNYSSNS